MERTHRGTVQKKILMTRITTMEWSLTQSQTSWSVKSSGPEEALLSVKLVEAMEFQKMMLSKFCTQYVSKFGKPSSGHRTGKNQSSSQFPRRVVLNNVLIIRQLHSSHMLVVMLKILHARLQHYANQEFPDVQPGFR